MWGSRGGAVGWGTALQAGRSRVLFLIFIDIIVPAVPWPWVDSASNNNECQEYFRGEGEGRGGGCWKRLGRRADNFTNLMCRLSCSLATSSFWNRRGMFRDCFCLYKWWSVLFSVGDNSYPVYFLWPAPLNIKMMPFGTLPSHCVSGCDRRNSRLMMIGMEKTNELGSLHAPVSRLRLLSRIDIREWTGGSSANISVWPPELWRVSCVEPYDWIFRLIDCITYCQLVMSVDWSPADFRVRG